MFRYACALSLALFTATSSSAEEWKKLSRHGDWKIYCNQPVPRHCAAVQSVFPDGRPDVVVDLVFEITDNTVRLKYDFPLRNHRYPTEHSWHNVLVGGKSRFFEQNRHGCVERCSMPLPIPTSELHLLAAKGKSIGLMVGDPEDSNKDFFFEMPMAGFTRAEVALRKALKAIP